MEQENPVSYREIHTYMLQKTQEYYRNPPEALIEDVLAAYRAQGDEISRDDAKKYVSLLNVQRYVKEEMARKWPEFMGSIPSNPLSKTVD